MRIEKVSTVEDAETGREVFDSAEVGDYRMTLTSFENRRWITLWDGHLILAHWEPVNGISTDDRAQFGEDIDRIADACARVFVQATGDAS